MAEGICTQLGRFSLTLGHSSTANGTRYSVSMLPAENSDPRLTRRGLRPASNTKAEAEASWGVGSGG